MEFRPFLVKRISELAEGTREFALASVGGSVPAYKPGNFFLLLLSGSDGKKVFRPYSASSHPDEGELRFCVGEKGGFPKLLWRLKEGDTVDVSGPYGIFTLSEADGQRVFIAGGTGIAPMRSMLLQAIKEGKECTLFHSAKKQEGFAYFEEMRSLAKEHHNFKFIPAITQEEPDGWEGIFGRISAQAIKGRLGSLEGKTYYICGNREMSKAISEGLVAEGVPGARIKKEEWG